MDKRSIIVFIIFIIFCMTINMVLFYNRCHNKVTKVVKTSLEVDPFILSLKDEFYYIDDNLERYIAYGNDKDISASGIITNVNCNLDKTMYEDVTLADTSYDILMLVNKYYYLNEDYEPNDLIALSSKYSDGKNNKLRKEVVNAFMEMSDAALLDNIIIKNVSGYRSYSYQENLYNSYVLRDGNYENADKYSARAGYSEHQTGLCTDINLIDDSFENTDEFKWLEENAYKYGFILRFPKDKEYITGYKYEPWHYRYVGKENAKTMYEEDLTFEEYYAYYVEKGNN